MSTIGELFVNLKANTTDFERGMNRAKSSTNINRNAMNEYALKLDDATFKQVFMGKKLGQTESALNSQANAIKVNARMTKLMGSQTDILVEKMKGLQRHGVTPEMLMPRSTIGQFQMLNETIGASGKSIYGLSLGYRLFGSAMEKTMKGWSAQKVAAKMANGDMARYGIILRGIRAGQADLAMAFPIVGMAAVFAYGMMFKAALNADKNLKKLAETVGGKLGKAFEPVIKAAGAFLKVILTITGKFADFIIKFNEAHPTIAKFAGAILFLLPAMTLLLLPLKMGAGLFGGWAIAIKGVWTVMGGVISMIGLASSTFLAFAGIIGIVGGGILYLWRTNEGFKNGCLKAWDTIKSKGTEVFNGLIALFNTLKNAFKTGGIEGLFSKMGEIFKGFLANINTLLPKLSKKGTEMLKKIADGIVKGMPVFIQTAQTLLQTWLQNWVNNLPILLNAGMQILMALANGIIKNLPLLINTFTNILLTLSNFLITNLPAIINCGMQILMGLVNGIVNNLPMIVDAAIRIINSLVDFITANLPMLIDTSVKIITTLGNGIATNLPKIIEAALKIILALVNGIGKNLPRIIQAGIKIVTALGRALIQASPQILSAGLKLIVALGKGIINGTGKAISAMGKVASKMISELKKKVPSFTSIGSSIVKGIASGIKGAASSVVSALGGVVNNAVAAAKSKLKINSPSKVFMAIGGSVGEGLVKGIVKEGTNVANASKNLASNTISGYNAKLKSPRFGSLGAASNSKSVNIKVDNMNVLSKGDENRTLNQLNFLATI